MLEAEADQQLCRAQRYECSPERADTRAGHAPESSGLFPMVSQR